MHQAEKKSIKIWLWSNGRRSDESRFTQFQSDVRIRVRGEADEVMLPSGLVPTVQACGGAKIWACCSRSGPVSATVCNQTIRSADYLKILNDYFRLFHQWLFFSSLMTRAYSKTKSGPESIRHHFHTWIGHKSPDLNPIENLWDALEKVLRSSQTIILNLRSW